MQDNNIGLVIDSRYHLKEFLGGGRVGKVYLAKDREANKNVAIKILSEKTDSDIENDAFLREFKSVKTLNHPGVVKVYEKGPGYFTMEYVSGDSLSKLKEAEVAHIFEVGIDIARVLVYIHRQGVIHRDLKPENIKITNLGKVKILDFGFAIGHEVANLISSGHFNIAGTLNYMAPEAIKGFQIDPRADLYSLGIIFYELVTGQLPFKSSDILTTVVKQVETTPTTPSEYNPQITPGFEAIIMKLIEKSPAKRFQSADELLASMMRLAGRSEILQIKVDKGRKFLYPPKFSGNEKEMQQMLSFFKNAMKGRGSFILIKGEKGIGKTRFIQEFQSMHARKGTIFLEVCCNNELGAIFGAFAQVIYDFFKFLEKSNDPILEDISSKWGATLLPIVPVLLHKNYMRNVSPDDLSKEELQERLCQFFIDVLQKYSLGIFIDNLHWLDQDSAFLLFSLIKASQNRPIFLCGTYKDTERVGETHFERYLPRLKLKKLCEEIVLSPLSQNELVPLSTSMIAQNKISHELINKLYEVSRGIPLLAEETIKNMADDGLIYRKGGIWKIEIDDLRKIRRPSILEDTLLARYQKLDHQKQMIIQTAVVIGQRFSQVVLKRVSGLDDFDLDTCLPNLLQQGFLIRVGKKSGDMIIGSSLLSQMLYEKISSKKRQRLHERIAQDIEKITPEKIEDLAHHYFHARNNKKALKYLISAGDKCRKEYSYNGAIKHYTNALELAKQNELYEPMLNLYKKIGDIHSYYVKNDIAIDFYKKGLKLAQKIDMDEAPFHKGIGIAYYYKGDFSESIKHFKVLIKNFRNRDKDISEDLTLIASIHVSTGDYDEAEKLLKEALEYVKVSKNSKLRAAIYSYFGEIHFMKGHWPNAMNYYMRSSNILAHDGDYRQRGQIANGIAKIYLHKGKIKEAYRYLEEALYFCHLTEDRELKVMVELDLGILFEYQGKVIQAMKLYQEIYDETEDLDMKLGNAYACMSIGRVKQIYEKNMEASKYIQKGLSIFKESQINSALAESYLLLGYLYNNQGEYEKALKSFSAGEQAFVSINMKWKLAEIYTAVSDVFNKMDKPDNANKTLNKALKIAKKYDDEIMLGKIHAKYALFCVNKKLNKEALEHFVSSLVFLEKNTCLLECAKVYYEYGKVLLHFERSGDSGFMKVAIHQLEKAKEIYRKAEIQPLLNKTLLLIKECEREKTDACYKRDLAVKLREFGRKISETEHSGFRELEQLRKKLNQSIGDDMDVLEEIKKQIAQVENNFNKKLDELRNQNNNLLTQVEELKSEREGLLTLQKISNTINTVLDSKKLLNLIMDMVVEEVRAERGFIVLKEGSEGFTFKSARNFDKEELSLEDFKLSRSIVKKVIQTGEPVLTSDAQADERFQSQSIMDLKLRSILCVPFKIKDRVIGAVYLDNRFVSGLFTENDMDFLVSFSNQAAIAIENAFLYEELKEKERIEQEISIAARIQAGLLPKALPAVPGIEVYGKMIPARKVGGDYYDFIVSPDNKNLSLVIGDVSGKGIPAGLVMVMARLILHHFLRNSKTSTKETLLAANHLLKDNTEPFIFMSLLLARWDFRQQKFMYTGAGHENLIICRSKTEHIDVIPAGGVVLGVKDNIDNFLEEKEIDLEPGDTIILYTDGVTECVSRSGDMLELDGFLEMVRNHLGKSPKETIESLIDELKEYMGDTEQHDDITLTVARKC